MMSYKPSVADYVRPAPGTVSPADSLQQVRRLMETIARPTVIVAHDNRPIGVIRKEDVDRTFPGSAQPCARDVMQAGCPTVPLQASPTMARDMLEHSDLDSLPVVTRDGQLVGILPREAVTKSMDGQHSEDASSRTYPRRAFNVRPGMNVYSQEGMMLGLIDRMFLEGGRVTGLLVAYGLLHRKHKHLSFESVDHLEDKAIFLSIGQHVFHQLPDADPPPTA